MSRVPCPIGRREAASLAAMNVRTILTRAGVVYVGRSAGSRTGQGIRARAVEPRFQPRDVRGRFDSFSALQAAVRSDVRRTFMTESLSDAYQGR